VHNCGTPTSLEQMILRPTPLGSIPGAKMGVQPVTLLRSSKSNWMHLEN